MNIDEEARYQIRVGARAYTTLPTELVRDVVEDTVSSGAFVTYAVLFCISDGDLARPLDEIAKARGLGVTRLVKHLDQLDATGWLDRDVEDTDQGGHSVQRVFCLRTKRRGSVVA